MELFAAIVLFLSALFNLVAWPRFFKRVSSDPRARDEAGNPTAFYRVHAVLLAIALSLAAAAVVAGLLLLLG
ncbi:MAG: SCO4848 family membrane protein [Rhodoglobus sp.]